MNVQQLENSEKYFNHTNTDFKFNSDSSYENNSNNYEVLQSTFNPSMSTTCMKFDTTNSLSLSSNQPINFQRTADNYDCLLLVSFLHSYSCNEQYYYNKLPTTANAVTPTFLQSTITDGLKVELFDESRVDEAIECIFRELDEFPNAIPEPQISRPKQNIKSLVAVNDTIDLELGSISLPEISDNTPLIDTTKEDFDCKVNVNFHKNIPVIEISDDEEDSDCEVIFQYSNSSEKTSSVINNQSFHSFSVKEEQSLKQNIPKVPSTGYFSSAFGEDIMKMIINLQMYNSTINPFHNDVVHDGTNPKKQTRNRQNCKSSKKYKHSNHTIKKEFTSTKYVKRNYYTTVIQK